MYDSIMANPYPKFSKNPETGAWYKASLPGCVCSCGKPYYAYMKIGLENKLMVMFEGGGAAINEYTATRPRGLFYEGHRDFTLMTWIFEYGSNHDRNWCKFRE